MPADPYSGSLFASVLTEEEVVCRGCGKKWSVEVRARPFGQEYGPRHWAGRWLVNEDDLICFECGTEAD